MLLEDNDLEMKLFQPRYLKQKNYWIRKLSGQVETTDFLKDSNNHRGDTFETGDISAPINTGHYKIPFDDKPSKQILNICKHSELSLYIFLLSAIKFLIHRYTTQKDAIIISPIHGGKATEKTINNLVLIRNYVDGTMTFKDLVLNLRNSVLEAYENQDYPYEKLEEYLFPYSSPTHISCCLDNIHRKADIEKIKARLSFCFSSGGGKINGHVLYDPNFYRESEIHRISNHFFLLLTNACENVDTKIADIDFLTEEEKKQLLKDFNNNRVDFSRNKTLPHWFEEQVEKTPDAVSIACNHNQATYIELNRKANRTAKLLRIYNLKQDQTVGILFHRSHQMVEGILAVWKAGGAYIPLDTDDPVQRLQEIITDSAVEFLLSQTQWVPPQLQKTYNGNILLLDEQQKEFQQDKENRVDSNLNIDPGSLAYVIYTSGSTGKPKGAMVEHIGMMNHIHAKIYDLRLTAKSIVAQNASHTFDISVWQFFAAFATGGKIIIYPHQTVVEPARFISRLIADQVTVLEVVPSYLSIMLEFLYADFRHFGSLKYLLVTGETIKPELVSRWFDKYPAVNMVNAYGPTEASDDITHFIMDKPLAMERVPIGKPVRNLNVYILDEYMNLCPSGIRGEICVSGVGVGRGYLNNPELTAEKFGKAVDSYSSLFISSSKLSPNDQFLMTNDRLYQTGDLGRWLTDGTIEFFGRKDHQIKIRGFRIELGEIESQLLDYEGIKEAVVLVREEDGGGKYICAYFVSDREYEVLELRESLSKELPNYMIPSYFVQLGKIPLTPNGKIDRRALPGLDLKAGDNYVAPRNEIEEKLVTVWSEVLNIDQNRIGINANFFEMGGHSLKALRVLSMLANDFEITMNQLFKYQTISELAANIHFKKDCMKKQLKTMIEKLKNSPVKDNSVDMGFGIFDDQNKYEIQIYNERIEKEKKLDLSKTKNYKRILLTGSTGYLGANLLHSILNRNHSIIYLPVRANSQREAENRLEKILTFYFGPGFYKKHKERLIVIKGDLALDHLGVDKENYRKLSAKTDVIIHAAAIVKHFGDYADFYQNNVKATDQLLEFAVDTHLKDFNYISTISVCSGSIPGKAHQVYTEYQQDFGQDVEGYYVQSKFEAEKHVIFYRQKGLNTSIYRVGNIVFNSNTGKFQINIDNNAFYKIIASVIKFGLIPGELSLTFDFTFVDYLARAIILLFDREVLGNEIFHLYNDNDLAIDQLVTLLQKNGEKIKQVPLDQFYEYLYANLDNPAIINEMDRFLLHLGFMENFKRESNKENSNVKNYTVNKIVCDRTKMFLQKMAFEWPKVNREQIKKMLEYCRSVKFLK